MRYLSKPIDDAGNELDAESVYSVCVNAVQKASLRAKMDGIKSQVTQASKNYSAWAFLSILYLVEPEDTIDSVSKDEMVEMFERLRRSTHGRPIYLRIKKLARHNKCAYCDIGAVESLDHHLPKSKFPIFAVTPLNLVASCTWCQGKKDAYYSTTEEGQILHPYFDDLNDEVWLSAEVIEGDPLAFKYFVSTSTNWSAPLLGRLASHLEKLNLYGLFSDNAASRASEVVFLLNQLYAAGGEVAVRDHLKEVLASLESDHLNSWAAAMYRAAVASDWFCDGGFNQI